ncbi:MAG: type I restriction enzyme HsdR N-terminal domain-containing protein [bacterium]|nr:type I restriction enzyme HsdR N-terminal domain-containing protein [bacterium]
MQELNFPTYQFQLNRVEGKEFIFDSIRKKWVVLTPEEWVRQHVILFLVQTKKYPASLVAVERLITFNKLKKRFDILLYNKLGKPKILIECKAPEVALSKETLFQISTYNMVFKVPFLLVSNGLNHLLFQLNEEGKYMATQEFPLL